VADDEPIIVRALERLLTRAGHVVHGAADADQALALLEQHRFDAALVDHHMPGGGARVLEAITRQEGFEGPAVLMTGDDVDDPSLPRGRGVVRLQKPFRYPDVVELLERGRG
jgi:CheY-like chemotaxis protein